jgi:hypothetical protein
MIIAEIKNPEENLTAVVSQIGADKFSVAVRDDDANEFYGCVYLYATLDRAMEEARKINV